MDNNDSSHSQQHLANQRTFLAWLRTCVEEGIIGIISLNDSGYADSCRDEIRAKVSMIINSIQPDYYVEFHEAWAPASQEVQRAISGTYKRGDIEKLPNHLKREGLVIHGRSKTGEALSDSYLIIRERMNDETSMIIRLEQNIYPQAEKGVIVDPNEPGGAFERMSKLGIIREFGSRYAFTDEFMDHMLQRVGTKRVTGITIADKLNKKEDIERMILDYIGDSYIFNTINDELSTFASIIRLWLDRTKHNLIINKIIPKQCLRIDCTNECVYAIVSNDKKSSSYNTLFGWLCKEHKDSFIEDEMNRVAKELGGSVPNCTCPNCKQEITVVKMFTVLPIDESKDRGKCCVCEALDGDTYVESRSVDGESRSAGWYCNTCRDKLVLISEENIKALSMMTNTAEQEDPDDYHLIKGED